MKTIQEWLDAYAVSHQNPTNKTIHWICVPLIVFSLLGLLWIIPMPEALPKYVNACTLFIALACLFYLKISWRLLIGFLPLVFAMLYGIVAIEAQSWPSFWIYLSIFVLAWVGQFVGHKIEGAKPSFIEDIQFLLIGPIWLLHFIYKKLGLKY